jgi:hypothetical protein
MLVFIIVKNKVYVGIPKRAEPGYAGSFNKESRARNMLIFIQEYRARICWQF